MRADARANREALLTAARRLYAERQAAPPYSVIASEAGVGIATLYRHFPTPDDLVMGLVADTRDTIRSICARGLAGLAQDPEQAWPDFVMSMADLELGALMPQLLQDLTLEELPDDIAQARTEVLAAVGEVVSLAKAAGLVREDVTPLHFQAGIGAMTRPLPPALVNTLPDLRGWLVSIYLAGLRPTE